MVKFIATMHSLKPLAPRDASASGPAQACDSSQSPRSGMDTRDRRDSSSSQLIRELET